MQVLEADERGRARKVALSERENELFVYHTQLVDRGMSLIGATDRVIWRQELNEGAIDPAFISWLMV